MKKLCSIVVTLSLLVSFVYGSIVEEKVGTQERSLPTSVVFDSLTGLWWEDTAHTSRAHGQKIDWKSAIVYCESLSLQNYDDWRLPNINELKSMDVELFRNLEPTITYWSSTSNNIHHAAHLSAHVVVFYDKNYSGYSDRIWLDGHYVYQNFHIEYSSVNKRHHLIYDGDAGNNLSSPSLWLKDRTNALKCTDPVFVRCVR